MVMTSLLIVVDVQNGFVNSKSGHVVEPIVEFSRDWLSTGSQIVFTRFHNLPQSQWENLIHWNRLRESPEVDLVDPISRFVDCSLASSTVHVVDKFTYTSLTSPVQQLIFEQRVDTVAICGIATDSCVLKTAIDLFEMGTIRPLILTDLCSSHAGKEIHEAGLLLASRFIGSDQLVESTSLLKPQPVHY